MTRACAADEYLRFYVHGACMSLASSVRWLNFVELVTITRKSLESFHRDFCLKTTFPPTTKSIGRKHKEFLRKREIYCPGNYNAIKSNLTGRKECGFQPYWISHNSHVCVDFFIILQYIIQIYRAFEKKNSFFLDTIFTDVFFIF